jgi:hypothetical protein
MKAAEICERVSKVQVRWSRAKRAILTRARSAQAKAFGFLSKLTVSQALLRFPNSAVIPMAPRIDSVIIFLNRAEDLRTRADGTKDPAIRSDILRLADNYEQAARHAMERGAVNLPDPNA